jgi:hypothetical protein
MHVALKALSHCLFQSLSWLDCFFVIALPPNKKPGMVAGLCDHLVVT